MKKSSMYNEIMDQFEVLTNICSNKWDEANKVNKLLKKADNIIFLGTGASLNACYCVKDAVIKYLGVLPHIVEMGQADSIIGTLTENTVCFLVSQSGSSKETVDVAGKINSSSAVTIAVTNNEESYLRKNCDLALMLESGVEISSATKTQTASAILMLMAVVAHNSEAVTELNKLPEAVSKSLELLPDVADIVAKKIKDEKALYLGALGTMYPVARQASLLIKEKDFILAEGLSISELRHGTVEAVYENMPIFILAYNGYIQEALSHAKYFAKITKADVYLVISSGIGYDEDSLQVIEIKNLEDEVFSSICPTIFFQILSEKIAELKGYDIDGFRYLSKVVDKY